MTRLEKFLRKKANEIAPIHPKFPDTRRYQESVSPSAIDGAKWLDDNTSYIWKVGVLGQWDSNKFDYARLFIGHEREPGRLEFIGCLHWQGGENDDIGRCLQRYVNIAGDIHPVFIPD